MFKASVHIIGKNVNGAKWYKVYKGKTLYQSDLLRIPANSSIEISDENSSLIYRYKTIRQEDIKVKDLLKKVMRDRFEAMLFGMMYGDFDYNNFKSGTLPLDVEQQYFEFLEEDLPGLEPLIIETATGVSSVVSVIEREKPDLVLIDGVYLMEDDQGAKDDWLRVAHITRDLKKLAKRCKIPIFINTQADKNTSKKTGPEIGSIMYTQAIGQDSDDILALYRDESMLSDREMCIKVLKQREGVTGKIMMNWNFDTMDFSEIYAETDDTNFTDDGQPVEVNNVIGVDDIEVS